MALRAARTPPPPPPPLHDRTGRVTAQHAQDAQHAHGTHTCGRTISFRNKPSVAVDALLKCSRRWQLVNDAIPCNKKSGFSTVQCTGLIVREPRRVVRCGGESTHIAVQLTNDDVRRPAEWRWRRPACSCFGAASLANERSVYVHGSTPSRFQRVKPSAISHGQKSNSVVGPRTGRVDIFPRDLGSQNSYLN